MVVINRQEIPGKSTAFGIIDIHSVNYGDHQHSVPLIEDGPTGITGGRVYQARDSTVIVWKTKGE